MIAGERHWVVVGLGNPGPAYAHTRHNMGYLVVQRFAQEHGLQFKEEQQFVAQAAKGKVAGQTVHLLLPLTYMNASGVALRRYLDYYKLGSESVIVIADDVAFAFGQMRVRVEGTSGGHNGLKSVQAALQTTQYMRVRIGIGQKPSDGTKTLAEHVLDLFTEEEKVQLPLVIAEGANLVGRLIHEDIATVMNSVNVRQSQNRLGESKDVGEERKSL